MLKRNRTLCVLLWLIAVPASLAQAVGNGSSIAPSAGEREAYGVNDPQSSQAETAFATRHYSRGNATGIGGSFLGTTSPTSESSPALPAPTSQPLPRVQFRLPNLDSAFPAANPALQTFTPALPSLPRNSALTSPVTNPELYSSSFSHSSVEALPSFSKRPSVFDTMQFNKFDSLEK